MRRSAELGFLNGHVPVTAVITAAALVAAVLERRDAVVLSNEWSASVPTVVADGLAVNHQWSKSEEFERAFGELVRSTLGPGISVFSYPPPAQRAVGRAAVRPPARSTTAPFAAATAPSTRTRRSGSTTGAAAATSAASSTSSSPRSWTASTLEAVFAGDEPLQNPANEERFRALLGLGAGAKPFECVGDTDECRAATLLAAQRADRDRRCPCLTRLRAELAEATPADPAALLQPRGTHRIPDRYAPADLLVRAR